MSIFIRTVPNVMRHFHCSEESAQRYIDLRDEGHPSFQAAIMAGLADPPDYQRPVIAKETGTATGHPHGCEAAKPVVSNGQDHPKRSSGSNEQTTRGGSIARGDESDTSGDGQKDGGMSK